MSELSLDLGSVKSPQQINIAADFKDEVVDFDWSDPESLVLSEQPETAIYWNPRGELVIRQRRWPDDDSILFISASNVGQFVDRLTDIVGIPSRRHRGHRYSPLAARCNAVRLSYGGQGYKGGKVGE